jgi:hypothetical protein
VQVHHDEGVANRIDPPAMSAIRSLSAKADMPRTIVALTVDETRILSFVIPKGSYPTASHCPIGEPAAPVLRTRSKSNPNRIFGRFKWRGIRGLFGIAKITKGDMQTAPRCRKY